MSISGSYVYEIRIEGLLPDRWSDWLEGLTIQHSAGEETILGGRLVDQAALLGVLTKIQGLNLKIVSVNRIPADVDPVKVKSR